jgi:hypothetical protein
MILYPVESTMLASVGYDAKMEALVVLFNTGRAYIYRKVPFQVYMELISAESKGKYMHEKIIGTYPAAVFKGWSSLNDDRVTLKRPRPPFRRR